MYRTQPALDPSVELLVQTSTEIQHSARHLEHVTDFLDWRLLAQKREVYVEQRFVFIL